jgi:hypothetical protein
MQQTASSEPSLGHVLHCPVPRPALYANGLSIVRLIFNRYAIIFLRASRAYSSPRWTSRGTRPLHPGTIPTQHHRASLQHTCHHPRGRPRLTPIMKTRPSCSMKWIYRPPHHHSQLIARLCSRLNCPGGVSLCHGRTRLCHGRIRLCPGDARGRAHASESLGPQGMKFKHLTTALNQRTYT